MKFTKVAILILMAGYAMSSERDNYDVQEPLDLPEDIKHKLNDADRQELGNTVATVVGAHQLIGGHRDQEAALLAEREFLESGDTEWWACGDAVRFLVDGGCGGDGCPVTLAANHSMGLGRVTFAGVESYAQYGVQGLERQWHWCLQDDNGFHCTFTLRAGGDGTYYDFNAASTTMRQDGRQVARPAGRFTCERRSRKRGRQGYRSH